MRLVEGTVEVGDDDGRFPDVEAFVDALDAVATEHDVTVQAFDARYVVSRRHLERAVELADRERARGDGIVRDRAVEVLLYAAGRRQIDRALEMGVGDGETPAVVLVDAGVGEGIYVPDAAGEAADEEPAAGEAADEEEAAGDEAVEEAAIEEVAAEEMAAEEVAHLLEAAETLGDYDEERLREFFDVGDAELAVTTAGLEDLVLERVALLVVER